MTLGVFVRRNRPRWQRLEAMLATLETRRLRETTRPFLQELIALYRATTGDLAFAQTHYRGTTLLLFLHQLVARAHNQIYRPHRVSISAALHYFRNEIPQAIRAHVQAVVWSAIVFLLGAAFGLSAMQFDERAATVILPPSVLNSVYSGQMWTGNLFSVVPAPVASTFIFTSNITVALLAFAGGLSFGVVTILILFQNGFLLGVVFKLCADYGLLGTLFAFVAGHGLLEISAIVVSGGAGLVVANALVNPGAHLRRDALSREGRSAIRMAIGCVPALITAGCIEAFISPSHAPMPVKMALGLTLGLVFWLYLLATGRRPARGPAVR